MIVIQHGSVEGFIDELNQLSFEEPDPGPVRIIGLEYRHTVVEKYGIRHVFPAVHARCRLEGRDEIHTLYIRVGEAHELDEAEVARLRRYAEHIQAALAEELELGLHLRRVLQDSVIELPYEIKFMPATWEKAAEVKETFRAQEETEEVG